MHQPSAPLVLFAVIATCAYAAPIPELVSITSVAYPSALPHESASPIEVSSSPAANIIELSPQSRESHTGDDFIIISPSLATTTVPPDPGEPLEARDTKIGFGEGACIIA